MSSLKHFGLSRHASFCGGRSLRALLSTSCVANKEKVLAIRREESSVWERRAPLSPAHVFILKRAGIKVALAS